MKKMFVFLACITLLADALLPGAMVFASEENASSNQSSFETFYSNENILYYNKDGTQACGVAGSSGGSGAPAAPLGGKLPQSTLDRLRNENFDARLARTKDRYVYAEQRTGIPWQMLAAIHYREAGMNPNMSIAAGEPLRNGKSMDGIQMSADPNEDARLGAEHLIYMAKSVYGIDLKNDRTIDGIANAFLAYNRGFMYKAAGESYTKSPYVMNGYDEQHLNMVWANADSYYKGQKLNSVAGTRDANLGALTIYSYLVGEGANATGPTADGSSSGAPGCTTGAVHSGECSVTRPTYGEFGNLHQLTRAELTQQYGEPGSQQSAGVLETVDFLGKPVQVHQKIAGCLRAVINEIKTKGIQYNIREIGAWRSDVGGGAVANGSSYHQFGVAIDINPSENPCCSVSRYTMPQGYIDAFHNHGFSWGGNWRSIKDYMHFEYNGPMQ